MSLPAQQYYVTANQNQAVARQAFVNQQPGLPTQTENAAVAVDLGNGQVGFVTQQKMMGEQTHPVSIL